MGAIACNDGTISSPNASQTPSATTGGSTGVDPNTPPSEEGLGGKAGAPSITETGGQGSTGGSTGDDPPREVDKPGDTGDDPDQVQLETGPLGSPSRLMPERPLAAIANGAYLYNPHRSKEYLYQGSGHTHAAPDHSGINPATQEARLRDLSGDHAHDFVWLTTHQFVAPDPGVDGILHMFGIEVYTKAMPSGGTPHMLAFLPNGNLADTSAEPFGRYKYTLHDLPGVIEAAGGLSVLAHPTRYSPSIQEVVQTGDALWGIGVVSGGTDVAGNYAHMDARLSAGKYTCASGGNDLHGTDYGQTTGYQLVSSSENPPTRQGIFDEVSACNFFACRVNSESYAPVKNPEVEVRDGVVVARLDGSGTIRFVGKNGGQLHQVSGTSEASYTPTGDEGYIRVELKLPAGGAACYSQALWVMRP